MPASTLIDIHLGGRWVEAASLQALTPDGKGRLTDFRHIATLLGTLLPSHEMPAVLTALKAFGAAVARLPEVARDQGVAAAVLNQCQKSIERVARELQDLTA